MRMGCVSSGIDLLLGNPAFLYFPLSLFNQLQLEWRLIRNMVRVQKGLEFTFFLLLPVQGLCLVRGSQNGSLV